MAIDWGFNFRATASFVTDGANETPVLGEQYPHTYTIGGQAVTAGWNADLSANTRDRVSSNDRRLAGINFKATGAVFRIDLPAAGTYKVYCAAGDAGASGNSALWDLCDSDTVLQSLTGDGLDFQVFKDATDTLHSHSAWPAANAPITATFATSIFKLKIRAAPLSNNVIAHIRIQSVDQANPRRPKRALHEPTPEYSW